MFDCVLHEDTMPIVESSAVQAFPLEPKRLMNQDNEVKKLPQFVQPAKNYALKRLSVDPFKNKQH